MTRCCSSPEFDQPENLVLKVTMLLGYFGALRSEELRNIRWSDVQLLDSEEWTVQFQPSKARDASIGLKSFLLPSVVLGMNVNNVFSNYIGLVAEKNRSERFLKNWNVKGARYVQNRGADNIAETGKRIASLLGLPESQKYTSHCFRRTSATLFAEGGGTIDQLKRFGRWKCDSIAEG